MNRYILHVNIMVIVLLCSIAVHAETVVITGEHLNVRSGPGRTYDIIDVAHKHERFEALERQEGWIRISVEGMVGWVPEAATDAVADTTIQDLLAQADSYFQRQQFTTPADANAYDIYRKVLHIQPDNVHAQKRIQQMARTYKIWAEHAKNSDDLEKATIFYQRYLYLIPDDAEIQRALHSLKRPDSIQESSLKILRLRHESATLSQQHIVHMIQQYHFHHPSDWSKYGLAPSMTGHFRHEYTRDHSHGIPIIHDHATQLMWLEKGPDKALTWRHAVEYVKRLNQQATAGYTDWRLPTIEELASLMEAQKTSSGLYLDPIFGSQTLWCWSADRSSTDDSAWLISFNRGGIQQHTMENTAFMLAVRSDRE